MLEKKISYSSNPNQRTTVQCKSMEKYAFRVRGIDERKLIPAHTIDAMETHEKKRVYLIKLNRIRFT